MPRRRMGEWRYSSTIHDLVTRWRWVASFMLPSFYPWEINLGTHWTRGWMVLRHSLDDVEKRKIFPLPKRGFTRKIIPICISDRISTTFRMNACIFTVKGSTLLDSCCLLGVFFDTEDGVGNFFWKVLWTSTGLHGVIAQNVVFFLQCTHLNDTKLKSGLCSKVLAKNANTKFNVIPFSSFRI
jgi:hypothetical protein